jgi:hypothetical protein
MFTVADESAHVAFHGICPCRAPLAFQAGGVPRAGRQCAQTVPGGGKTGGFQRSAPEVRPVSSPDTASQSHRTRGGAFWRGAAVGPTAHSPLLLIRSLPAAPRPALPCLPDHRLNTSARSAIRAVSGTRHPTSTYTYGRTLMTLAPFVTGSAEPRRPDPNGTPRTQPATTSRTGRAIRAADH